MHLIVRDAPLDFKGGAGSYCKKKNLIHSKVKKKKRKETWPTHRRKKKKTWPTWEEKKKTLSCSGEKKKKKTYPHIEEGEKYTPGISVIPRGGGRPLSKGGYPFDLWQWQLIPIQSAACRWMLWTSNIVWSMSSLCT